MRFNHNTHKNICGKLVLLIVLILIIQIINFVLECRIHYFVYVYPSSMNVKFHRPFPSRITVNILLKGILLASHAFGWLPIIVR